MCISDCCDAFPLPIHLPLAICPGVVVLNIHRSFFKPLSDYWSHGRSFFDNVRWCQGPRGPQLVNRSPSTGEHFDVAQQTLDIREMSGLGAYRFPWFDWLIELARHKVEFVETHTIELTLGLFHSENG